MNRNCRILINIAAVSLVSFPAFANDKPAGYDRPEIHHPPTCVAGGLTSFEQAAQNADLAITARIRDGVSAAKTPSFSARNVKIITSGGRVVLKGVVNTVEEKRLIGEIAIGVRRRENVDNRLEVKPPPLTPTALRVVP